LPFAEQKCEQPYTSRQTYELQYAVKKSINKDLSKKRIDTTKSTLRTGADERKRNMRINSGMVFR